MTGQASFPRRLPATQLGVHLADPDTADAVTVHSAGGGLIVGADQHGNPVTMTLFRPEPTLALLVGALRFAQLIAFRALAIGAQVLVQTGRTTAWSTFARESALRWGTSPTSPGVNQEHQATVNRPRLLIVGDSESSGTAEPLAAGAWSTVLMVRNELSETDTSALERADLALMQRLSTAEARLVCPIMNVPDEERTMTRVRGDMVALITHSHLRWARVVETMIERRVIGPIDRFSG